MNSTGRLTQKGSVDAAEYAKNRKEKMERARQLREERKTGVSSSASSNVFKSAAERSVHRQGSQNRSQQHTQMSNANGQDTTATSMLSSPSIQGGRMNQDPLMGNQGGPQYAQQMPMNHSQMGYGNATSSGGFAGPPQGGNGHLATQQIFPGDNFMPPQMDAFSTPLNAGGGHGQMGNNFGGPPPMHGGNQNFGPPHNTDGFIRNSNNNLNQIQQQREGVIINSRTQDNYYHHQQQQQQPGMQRNRSMQNQFQNQQQPNTFSPGSNNNNLPPRHQPQHSGAPQGYPQHSPGPQSHSGLQTIQHDPAYRQQTQVGFNSQNMQTQQEFGAFRSAAGTQYPGHQTPNRQTHYSQRDVNEARGSLTLLKKRMSNSRDRGQKNSTIEHSSSNNNRRDDGPHSYHQPNGQLEMGNHNSQSQRNSMQPMSTNGDRFGGQSHVPPRPPRVNQSQVYNDGGLSGADSQSTPGGRSNYRKVFKPNIPAPSQADQPSQQEELDLDTVNNIGLGQPPQHARRQGASQRSENQVPKSSPDKTRARVGLPPREKPQAMARKPQQSNGHGGRQRQPQEEPQYEEDTYEEPKPTNYNFDEAMQDPFGSKKTAVMNTPPKNMEQDHNTYGQPPARSNFNDELAGGNSGLPEQPRENDSLRQCATCERKFNAKALERHSKVCVKVFQTKRKAFDVAEQRKATDASGKGVENDGGSYGGRGGGASYKPKMPGRKPASTAAARGGGAAQEGAAVAQKKIPKWKLQSLQFRQAVGPIPSSGGGGGASNFNPTQEASIDTDDRIPCQYCGRKFAEKTAERHIPYCETKYKANLMKGGPPKASGAARRAPSKGMRR